MLKMFFFTLLSAGFDSIEFSQTLRRVPARHRPTKTRGLPLPATLRPAAADRKKPQNLEIIATDLGGKDARGAVSGNSAGTHKL